jgi:hypothetical protein
MYISIDRDKCRFIHKHADVHVVANLDFIANLHDSTDVMHLSSVYRSFDSMTDQELSLLYQHTTRQDPPYVGDSLRALLQELAEQFPETPADARSAEMQAAAIEANHPNGQSGLVYVAGSTSPGLCGDGQLFPLVAALPQPQAAAAVQKHLAARAKRVAAASAPREVVPPTPGSTPVAQPRKAGGAPRSGVCKAIWDALDAQNMPGGSPTREWLKVYGATQGWNPSTISVQYTAWKKAKGL